MYGEFIYMSVIANLTGLFLWIVFSDQNAQGEQYFEFLI